MQVLPVLVARAVALLWAAVWIYFFIAETTETAMQLSAGLPWLALGILFIGNALVPWRWEAAGSWSLIGVAVVVGIAYAVWAPGYLAGDVKTMTIVAFCCPPLLSGILLLVHRWSLLHRHSSLG